MTKQEEKEIIRVCGPNYKESDIPAFIRNRDLKELEAEDRMAEELRQEELAQERDEEIRAIHS